MAYLNKALKEMVINLSGLQAYLNLMMEDHPGYTKPHIKKIKTMVTYLEHIIHDFLKDLDVHQIKYLANQCNNCNLILVPNNDPKMKKLYTVVETQVLQELVNTAFSECFLCDKCGKEARECKLRKNLLEVGAMAHENGKGQCPFKHGQL